MHTHKLGGDIIARTGRPPIQDTSRNEHLSIRLTKEEKEEINYCSEKLGIPRTDAIMKGIKKIIKEIEKE